MARYALITVDPNSHTRSVVSLHRSLRTAGKAYQHLAYARWSFVAERDERLGTWALRGEAGDVTSLACDAANAA
jgi:hypothetical protein